MVKNQFNNVLQEEKKGILKRSGSIYYIGTLFFIAGIILFIFGTISIMFFQVHYGSESEVVLPIIIYIGLGLMCIAFGINIMIYQSKKGYVFSFLGLGLVICSIILFLLNYENNWYYPIINYVLITYISGLILLMGNAFGNATVRLINSATSRDNTAPVKTKTPKYEYTDEEIERDIEEAVKKSLTKAADDIQFDLVNTKTLKVGNSEFATESVVKVHDPIDESYALNQTINPGEVEEWGGTGIDKASSALAQALQDPIVQKQSWFRHFIRAIKSKF